MEKTIAEAQENVEIREGVSENTFSRLLRLNPTRKADMELFMKKYGVSDWVVYRWKRNQSVPQLVHESIIKIMVTELMLKQDEE